MSEEPKVTIAQIAAAAHVNSSTVSRALNCKTAHMISASMREKILAIAKELDYPFAENGSHFSGRTVGLILGAVERDLANPFFACFVAELSRKLQAQGAILSLLPSANVNGLTVAQLLDSRTADAYAVGAALLEERVINTISKNKTPVLTLNFHHRFMTRDIACLHSLQFDDAPGYCQMLTGLAGHNRKKLLFFGSDVSNTGIKLEMLHRSATELKLQFQAIDLLTYQPNVRGFLADRQEAAVAARRLWKNIRHYDAVICASDLIAMGVEDCMTYCDTLTMADDFALVGHDNLEGYPEIFGFPSTELATIDNGWKQAGAIAAEILAGPFIPGEEIHKTISSTFIARKSLHMQKEEIHS